MKLEDIVVLAKAGYTAEQIDGFIQYGQQTVPQPVPQPQTVPQPVPQPQPVQQLVPQPVQQPQTVPQPVPQPLDILTRGGSREIKSFDDVYNMMRELSNQIIASNVVASRQPETEYNPSEELAKIINPYEEEE